MIDNPDDRIETLGLSKTACSELRKCHVYTIQDLMILINQKLTAERSPQKESEKQSDNSYIYDIPLRIAIPEVIKNIRGAFDLKIIRDKLRKKYGNRVTTRKNSIKVAINKLLRDGTIERVETGDYIYINKKKGRGGQKALDRFLDSHVGKEIEFRYKTERTSSDKRWRRETVWAHDEKYLYAKKQYISGHHVLFLKERIVDYRGK